MTSAVDAISAVIAGGRGPRPASLDNEETEKVLAIALALLVELSNANDRIDRLEREVADLRGEPYASWKEAPQPADAEEARRAAIEAMQLRVIRIMVDPRT